jgi:hypothetical protein
MLKVYEPLEYFSRKEKLSIFLAGGIDRAPDWQRDAIGYINQMYGDLDLAILNPRRSTPFTTEDYEARGEQVEWEFTHLRYAGVILFWFPDNAPCTTSLLELGYWLNSSKISLGINPGHYKERSIKTQIALLNKSRVGIKVNVASTLEDTVDTAIRYLNSGF